MYINVYINNMHKKAVTFPKRPKSMNVLKFTIQFNPTNNALPDYLKVYREVELQKKEGFDELHAKTRAQCENVVQFRKRQMVTVSNSITIIPNCVYVCRLEKPITT